MEQHLITSPFASPIMNKSLRNSSHRPRGAHLDVCDEKGLFWTTSWALRQKSVGHLWFLMMFGDLYDRNSCFVLMVYDDV